MECLAPKMRNPHFIREHGDAQYALRAAHQNPTIQRMTVGEKIRAIRVAKGMTLAEVEGRAGLTDGNLSRIERGKQWASEDVLRAIAQALLVRVVEFFDDEEIPTAVSDGYRHPATQEIRSAISQAADEVRLLTVYRLANASDRAVIDSAIDDVIERLDVVSILNKR
ncbi:helix-turn-helix domain-containing protein [Massilia sp. 9096]|uniref:helix-turn-helix domain-containing protein n=1 Tax=Massilia sp. 9096 TaxID=1500894 RepID=UPI0018CE11E0|nr:helix-turn-helix transcriptional regulator [Massilia sp. 9096]